MDEFSLIHQIRHWVKRTPPLTVELGDDAAVFSVASEHQVVCSTDMLIEQIHFDLHYTSLYDLGWKAAAVNLSDLAAMGASPRYLLIALGLSRPQQNLRIKKLYTGLQHLCNRYQTKIIGGDTVASKKLIINITILGEIKKKEIKKRSGAKPGDWIVVTGTLGDSGAGLEILQQGEMGHDYLKQRHLRPLPRIIEGRHFACQPGVHAMMDISDGLSSDLNHICQESGVGAMINLPDIPLSSPLLNYCHHKKRVPFQFALNSGEDYELLLTCAPSQFSKKNVRCKIIGKILPKKAGIWQIQPNGKKVPLLPKGYQHFH